VTKSLWKSNEMKLSAACLHLTYCRENGVHTPHICFPHLSGLLQGILQMCSSASGSPAEGQHLTLHLCRPQDRLALHATSHRTVGGATVTPGLRGNACWQGIFFVLSLHRHGILYVALHGGHGPWWQVLGHVWIPQCSFFSHFLVQLGIGSRQLTRGAARNKISVFPHVHFFTLCGSNSHSSHGPVWHTRWQL